MRFIDEANFDDCGAEPDASAAFYDSCYHELPIASVAPAPVDTRTRFYQADEQTRDNVQQAVGELRHTQDVARAGGYTLSESEQRFLEEMVFMSAMQKQMKDHPFSPGQTKAFVKLLEAEIKSQNIDCKTRLRFDPRSGHAVMETSYGDNQIKPFLESYY